MIIKSFQSDSWKIDKNDTTWLWLYSNYEAKAALIAKFK